MEQKYKLRNSLWVSILSMLLISTGCDLEIEETDSLITEGGSSVFNGVEDVEGSIANIYTAIRDQTQTQENLYALTEATTDEQLVPTRGTDWGDNGVWRTLHTHTWSSTHAHILNVWNDKNGAVLRATEVIDPLSAASAEQIAHAKFARAYNMWIVMDFYGQVPFRNPTDGPDILPTVMTRAEAYDMVVQDLTDAIEGLPASDPTAADKSRAVKATARLFLAKVKLNAEVYKGSYGANDLQDVIDLVDAIEAEGYSLTGPGTYFDVFPGTNVANPDVIWSVNATVDARMWNSLHYHQAHPGEAGGGWNGFTTLAEFYEKFEGPENDNSIGQGQEERRGYTQTLETTDDTNFGFGYGFQLGQMYGWRYKDEEGNDTPVPQPEDKDYVDPVGREVALKARNGEPLAFTKELPGLVGNNEVTGIRLLKYSPADGARPDGVVMARFADAHLMRAEAMLRMGDNGGALDEVNELRAMRENTPPLTSLDESELLDERAREFYLEGWRRNDLIRFGMFGTGSWEFKEANDGHTNLFPIPSNALLSNPNLVQNPGY